MIDEGHYRAISELPDEEEKRKYFADAYYDWEAERRYRRRVFTFRIAEDGRFEKENISDDGYSPFEIAVMEEEAKAFHDAIRTLKEREQYLIEQIYLRGKKQKEVAKELNIDSTTICKLHKRCLEKLKSQLIAKGYGYEMEMLGGRNLDLNTKEITRCAMRIYDPEFAKQLSNLFKKPEAVRMTSTTGLLRKDIRALLHCMSIWKFLCSHP